MDFLTVLAAYFVFSVPVVVLVVGAAYWVGGYFAMKGYDHE